MKLKNSYILIGIAIFLLISIGSVCASENVTDNVDVQTADDGKDVVLSDTDENVPDETAQEKINTLLFQIFHFYNCLRHNKPPCYHLCVNIPK